MGGVNLNARVFLENLHKIEVVLTPCSYAYIICTCVDPLLFSRTHHVCLFVCFVGQSLIFWFEFKQYYTHDNRLKLTLYKSCIINPGSTNGVQQTPTKLYSISLLQHYWH